MTEPSIRKGNIDLKTEKKILTLCITNTQFLKEVLPFLNADSFQLSHSKRIFRWVKFHFDKYECAPNKTIADIFFAEKERINDDESEMISSYLESLSLSYTNEDDADLNVKYYADKAKDYVRKRNLENKVKEISGLLALGKLDEAEENILGFKKIALETSNWINPLDESTIEKSFERKDQDFLFKLPGDLGDVLGAFNRGCTYCFAAALKIGKSFGMAECRNIALMTGLKVAEINIEMTESQVEERFYKRITGASKIGGISKFPVMDCKLNQDGSCRKSQRKNKIALYSHEDYIPQFEDSNKEYKVCTSCRETRDFIPTTWFEEIDRKELNVDDTKKTIGGFKVMWGNNYRLRVYPRFSANVSMIKHDLDFLEATEGFIPDVILVDYASLIKGERVHNEDRHRISEVFKLLGGIGAEKNCAVITASQINREGSKKRSSKTTDIAEDYAIGANVDALFIISQSEEEKVRKICRVAVGASRADEFDPNNEVIVLSDLSAGQWLLDSYSPTIVRKEEERNE